MSQRGRPNYQGIGAPLRRVEDKRFLTGRDPMSPVGFVNDHPMVGSMVARMRPQRAGQIPNYISGTDPGRDHIDVFSFGSAYLGPATHPFLVGGDPAATDFNVRNLHLSQPQLRVDDRLALLGRLDTMPGAIDATGTTTAMDAYRHRALDLLTTDVTRRAFDLNGEPRAVAGRAIGGHACWGVAKW